jgi:hypothetical protein
LPRETVFETKNSCVYDSVIAHNSWLLDRFSRVSKQYYSQSVNGIVSDVLANFTDGGFVVGDVDHAFGNLSITFTNETVLRALERVAAAVDAHVVLGPNRHVSILETVVDGHTHTIDNTETDFWDLRFNQDLSQARNRTTVEGQGSALAANASFGETTLTLESTGWASATGGSARLNQVTFTYTGKTSTTLTGVSGFNTDGAIGDEVNLVVTSDNASAQTAMATLLGGGLSGVVQHYIQDRRLSEDEAQARADEDVATFGDAVVSLSYVTRDPFVFPVKEITVNLTSPRTLAGTFLISSVNVIAHGSFSENDVSFENHVRATRLHVTLPSLLERVPSGPVVGV